MTEPTEETGAVEKETGAVENTERRRLSWERRTEWPLTGLALGYLVAYAVPIIFPHLPQPTRDGAKALLDAIWVVFAADYSVRLVLARRRGLFVRRHLLDLAVVLLPLLRPLRLLRLVVVLNVLTRHASIGLRGRVATYVGGAVALLTFVASLAVLDAERHNPGANIRTLEDALWWSVSTITTVGYGDRYPTTTEGRLVAAGLMLGGIALLGTTTGLVASWFVERVRRVEITERHMLRQLEAIKAELRSVREQLEADTRR